VLTVETYCIVVVLL